MAKKPPGSRSSKAAAQNPAASQESKTDKAIALLQRPEGATLAELVVATGWQLHTTRPALTGLRKKGQAIDSEKVDGVRPYRIGQVQ